MRYLLFAVSLSCILIISMGQRSPDGKNICPEAVDRFTAALRRIVMKFFKSYADANPNETGQVSSYAIVSVIVSLAYFAEGESKDILLNTIDLKSNDEIECVTDVVNHPLYNLPDCIELNIVYGYVSDVKDYPLTKYFMKTIKNVFYRLGLAQNLNFAKTDEAADTINAIVANLTKNQIQNFVENRSLLNSSTQIVSVNGMSLKSEWEIEFQIKQIEFRISPTESKLIEFLTQDSVYLYGHSELLEAEVVQVNFCCGSNFYLWVIVPDQLFAVDDLINKMDQNADYWYDEVKQALKRTKIDLAVVRYEQTTAVDSKPYIIDAINLTTIYDSKTLNLKRTVKGDKPVALSTSFHKTYLSSSPEGGPVQNGPLSNGPKKTFISNTPHVFVIFRENEVYFTAVLRGPPSSKCNE